MNHGCRAGARSPEALPEIAAMLERAFSTMLVLTRSKSEVIKIGDDVTVTVIRTSQGKVTLGIQAPRSLPVVRLDGAMKPIRTNETGNTL